MDIDHILAVFNRHEVRYLLIGGVHFLLRHKPVLTFDIDFWIDDDGDNRLRCERALTDLKAEWGQSEQTWGPVSSLPAGWLARQSVYCLSSPHGAIDIFRTICGLASWRDSFATSVSGQTAAGVAYRGLCDEDMLKCQLSLDPEDRKNDRIRDLKKVLLPHEPQPPK
jgi:hypothetical protein